VMRTKNGYLIDVMEMMKVVWAQLFRYDLGNGISAMQAWTALALFSMISLWLLSKKVRAFEVVK
jgi:hypothetical protein